MPSVADGRRTHSPSPGATVAAAIVGVGQHLLPGGGGRNGDGGGGGVRPHISSPTPSGLPVLEGLDLPTQLEELTAHLEKQKRIKEGAENMLQVVQSTPSPGKLRQEVENELSAANARIAAVTRMINQIKESPDYARAGRRVNGTSVPGPSASAKRGFFGAHVSTEKARHPQMLDQEDFRTALSSAKTYLANLASYAKKARSAVEISNVTPSPASSSAATADGDLDRARITTMAKLTAVLQRNVRVRYELDMDDIIQAVMPALSDHCSKEVRTAAYRLIRHVVVDANSVALLREEGLDWYMVKSLARDNKFVEEKEQVVKFVRCLIELRSDVPQSDPDRDATGCIPLSEAVLRAFVAVAEHAEDHLRLACLETLAELVLIDIDLVCSNGGLRVLLQALVDGSADLSPALANVFLYIVDTPRTRSYLRLGSDLEIAFSGFTEAQGRAVNAERMRACSRILSCMLRSWSGLLYFCMDNKRAISSLVDTLRIVSTETREIALELLFELLNIKPPQWHKEYIQGRRLTMYGRQNVMPGASEEPKETMKGPNKLTLVDHFVALLVTILVDAGLLEALLSIVEEKGGNQNVLRRAGLLLGEVLQIVTHVLPARAAGYMQSLPQLFALTTNYTDGDERLVGITALSSIESLNRNRGRLQPAPAKDTRNRANSVDDAIRRGQRQIEQTKIKMAKQLDDKSFQSMIVETQVNAHRDYVKWNFDALIELVEGPLMNPKRLEDMIRTSKFGRRLMSFFHPFNYRFCDIKRTKANQRYVRLGCSFLAVLMSCPDGQRFLAFEDKLMPQLTECFAQLDPFNGTPSVDPMFSKERVEETLTYGYFEMLGTLSKTPEGIEVLQRHKIWTAFYHLSELKSREDLIKGIIEHLDYSIDGHPRVVLSKALTSSYKHIRLFATQHLAQLIQESPRANEWTLQLLLTQLYDPAVEVTELAVRSLEEACQSPGVLEMIVRMRPTLEHLGEVGHPLLLRFMSDQAGFRYLRENQYIDREMDGWFQERNYQYVIQVEAFLSKSFDRTKSSDELDVNFEGTAPPHFYGEMAKTELGCDLLHEKGHFAEFAQFIRQHGLESEDRELIAKLKSVLWAVGNIGSQRLGFAFIEEEDILQAIIDIAEQSLVLSVRGTCYFVLGLLSCTSEGAEILYDYGWEATLTALGESTGICIPAIGDKMERFLDIPRWEAPARISAEPRRLPPPTAQIDRDVMMAVTNLSNTILANAASRTLAKTKSRHRRIFSSIPLFYRVLHIISAHQYRLPVRRYILDIFDVRLDPTTIASLRKAAAVMQEIGSPPNGTLPTVAKGPRESIRLRTRQRSMSDEEDLTFLADAHDEVDEEEGAPRQRLEPLQRLSGFGSDTDSL